MTFKYTLKYKLHNKFKIEAEEKCKEYILNIAKNNENKRRYGRYNLIQKVLIRDKFKILAYMWL